VAGLCGSPNRVRVPEAGYHRSAPQEAELLLRIIPESAQIHLCDCPHKWTVSEGEPVTAAAVATERACERVEDRLCCRVAVHQHRHLHGARSIRLCPLVPNDDLTAPPRTPARRAGQRLMAVVWARYPSGSGPADAGAGMAPSCCSIPSMSSTVQSSTTWPLATRLTLMPSIVNLLPVAAIPWNSARCVPL
jgi:hypothetical protein